LRNQERAGLARHSATRDGGSLTPEGLEQNRARQAISMKSKSVRLAQKLNVTAGLTVCPVFRIVATKIGVCGS
jgi:hypothetical protein